MMTSTRISRASLAVAVMLVLGLAGCGSGSDSAAKVDAKNKKSHAHIAIDPSGRALSDMVAAVTPAKAGPPVELKFELRESPQAGQMLDVDIAVVPDAPQIDRIYAKFQGGPGLDLVEGAELTSVDKPAAGAVIRHVVRVLPKEDGIFTVSATVSVDLTNDSITRSYSIPVIVGEGLPERTAQTEVAAGPSSAQSAGGTALKTH
jgi:hypothetical protein